MEFKTLGQFIVEKEDDFKGNRLEFSSIMSSIRLAAKIVNQEVNKAGIAEDIIGSNDKVNVQGEVQQKLDDYAHHHFVSAMRRNGEIAGIASEESKDLIHIDNKVSENAKYVVLMDPLDGSSNIDVNVSIGTIFSIYKRVSPLGTPVTDEDFLQGGDKQIAAGYVIYGSSTMLVYTSGNGVHGFTFDPGIGVFLLSHENMTIPHEGKYYSINEGNYRYFPDGIKKYIKYCQEYDEETQRPFSSRYIGSLVADFHRNLIKGGVFIYPETLTHPNGKLRLLYECYPLAMMIEQANGKASTGTSRLLDVIPTDIHQRTPFVIGSTSMVDKVEEFVKENVESNVAL